MALRKQRTRARRLIIGPVLGLTAALAAAGCTSGPAKTASTSAAGRPATPAITAGQARQVFTAYVAATAKAARTGDGSLALSVVTGAQRAVLAAALGSHAAVTSGKSSSGAYRGSLSVTLSPGQYSYGAPTFYLPERAGFPRFFVADVTQAPTGTAGGGRATATVGGATLPAGGPALLLFEQSAASAPWLLASDSRLPRGVSLPKPATDGGGYVPVVQPSAAGFLTQPDDVGALQAAVVDDGPSSAAAKAVAGGPLTTGMYRGAADYVDGLQAPHGDVYQWELDGSSLTQFALRTADGGALVWYAMTLDATVAVPGEINKADPVQPGPPIPVPLVLQTLLPKGQPAPRVQLQSEQTLSFAAIDPPAGTAKIQVIAVGGGLTSASAS
ncbi:MAG TPA: hypothetical protein VIZ43_18870 [Trebonia sp.]